jgi:hypothetical protein
MKTETFAQQPFTLISANKKEFHNYYFSSNVIWDEKMGKDKISWTFSMLVRDEKYIQNFGQNI